MTFPYKSKYNFTAIRDLLNHSLNYGASSHGNEIRGLDKISQHDGPIDSRADTNSNSNPGSSSNGMHQSVMHQLNHQLHAIQPFKKAWSEALSHPASSHIQPVAFRDHKLTVWVSSPVWANWLRHRHNSLISRVNELKLPFVQHILIRIAPSGKSSSSSPSSITADTSHTSISKTGQIRPKPSDKSIDLLEKTAQELRDPQLRAALERLTQTLNRATREK